MQRAQTRSVAILQGAVPQDMKWLESNQQKILDDYAALNKQALGADLIVWPESALPDLANFYPKYIGGIWSDSDAAGSGVLMGVMRVDDDGSSLLQFSAGAGERGPAVLRQDPPGAVRRILSRCRTGCANWLRLMSLPYSDFNAGAQ